MRAGCAPEPDLVAWARRVRARLLGHDHLGGAAAAAAHVHRLGHADRGRDRRGGPVRADALADRRAVERLVPYAARPPAAVHARRDRPDGVLPAADRIHAEPLDDGAARAGVLLRLLPLRAAVPRALPRRAAADRLRARPGNPARAARDRARNRPRRRQLPAQGVAPRPIPGRGVRHLGRVWRDDPARARGRRPRARVRGVRRLHQAELAHLLGRRRRAALPARELRLGGDVRGREELRDPLRDRGAARVADASPGRSWPRWRAAT